MSIEEIKNNISKNLIKLRKEKKLTQQQLIEKIGEENISLRTYKEYESKKSYRTPQIEKIIILAEFFGVSLDQIVLGKASTYDDSYTKKDNLKRISRLIYSLVLMPIKEEDSNSPFYNKYYFVSFDPEVDIFLENINTLSKLKNYNFEYKDIYNYKGIEDFDECMASISNLNEDWKISESRFNYNLVERGINPQEYLKYKIESINSKRNKNAYKKH